MSAVRDDSIHLLMARRTTFNSLENSLAHPPIGHTENSEKANFNPEGQTLSPTLYADQSATLAIIEARVMSFGDSLVRSTDLTPFKLPGP